MSSQRQNDEYECVWTGEQLQTFRQRTCRAHVDSQISLCSFPCWPCLKFPGMSRRCKRGDVTFLDRTIRMWHRSGFINTAWRLELLLVSDKCDRFVLQQHSGKNKQYVNYGRQLETYLLKLRAHLNSVFVFNFSLGIQTFSAITLRLKCSRVALMPFHTWPRIFWVNACPQWGGNGDAAAIFV